MHAAVLRYFEAVAEEGSIRRASERLSVSASAVNRQILKLEDHLGTPLFERRPDGMRLTESGRLVHEHFRSTLDGFARLRSEIDDRQGIISGTVTILTLDSLTVHFLPEALSGFIDRHPAVEVRVIADDPKTTTQAIAQGNADIGLTFSSPLGRGVRVLGEIPCAMHAIMTPDHELAGRSSVTLDECGAHPAHLPGQRELHGRLLRRRHGVVQAHAPAGAHLQHPGADEAAPAPRGRHRLLYPPRLRGGARERSHSWRSLSPTSG